MSLLDPRRAVATMLIACLTLSLAGCGTLFYPERKGQLPGRIDPGVAIADGIGLLFFIVPGVIAYAIDFSNNTIYLPGEAGAGIDATHLDDPADTAQVDALLASRGLPQGWQAEVVRVERPRDLGQALAWIEASRLDLAAR